MASLNETLSHLAELTPKVTVDETLRLLRPSIPAASMAAIPDDSSIPASEQQVLEARLISLTLHNFMLMRHKQNIEEAYDELEAEAQQLWDALSRLNRPCIPPHVLIRFVSTLEEANRYFDFKIRAKRAHDFEHLCSPDDVSYVLHQDEQLMSEFPKIGDTQLNRAADAIFWELYYQRLGSEYAYPFEDPKLHDWIYELAFVTREQGYAIDNDPIVELEKVREDAPFVYKESSVQEACSNYSQLVSYMLAKNKEASYEKTSIATGPGNKEAISGKLKVTATATGARHQEASSEKHELTSIATSAKIKEGFNDMHRCTQLKRSFEMTSDIDNFPKILERCQASKNESGL